MVEGQWADMALPAGRVAAAMLHLALLGVVFGALALVIGAAFGHLAAGRAIPAVVAVLAYVVNGLALQVSWLRPCQALALLPVQRPRSAPHRLSLAALLVAGATIAVLLGLAVAGFRRRDVAS